MEITLGHTYRWHATTERYNFAFTFFLLSSLFIQERVDILKPRNC